MADNLSQTLSARCFVPNSQTRAGRALHPPSSLLPDAGKKRGRPKMAPDADTSRMDRRAQIRYAQRTYRHKKDVMYRNMETRLAELERTMGRLSDSIADFHDMAVESDLHVTHPHLFDHLSVTLSYAKRMTTGVQNESSKDLDRPSTIPTKTNSTNPSSFGYIVNRSDDTECDINLNDIQNLTAEPNLPQTTQVYWSLPGSSSHTYSFQESDPSRMLQRYCLEYIYRLFSDPRSDPGEFYRVFRLVPCVKYKEKMGRYLFCLVRSDSDQPLEFPALPFYCIGGAGTHYPEVKDGKAVYPEHMRLPRRVLATVASLCSDEDISSVDRQKLLMLAGLDGTWLDSRDVIGYLKEKGVLDRDDQKSTPEGAEQVSWTLDIEGFFQAILANMVVLGRSPGFRFIDVEAAFTANLRYDSK
ncbi:hypothetical protein ASPVEDRAFT_829036 [Aspergillus versicolor CBS 583.65]|uniref:BZIP domain-containing protein n=1 Tax=Aspergillus versicolor CBS 583.65 TaxID=1036611 RepID=A0A1L9PU04_ASPVE|nr:uncharacterized protein ASPVEDRAFT_829036 [Aspergillus versicolor CBS 583.65]OJJ05008.1 hypothetical protein ASPVEDRAFT_829036 [Aspergillus versicolor CBS 583.65]